MKLPILLICLALTAAAVYFCCGIGFDAWESPFAMDETVHQIHLPRIYTALLVGAGLPASGAALQALSENPLVGPNLIGTLGGAALGVITLPVTGGGATGISATAFIGALGIYLLILAAHKLFGDGTLGLLVLSSVLSALSSTVASMILFLSDNLVLRSATIWLSGSLAEAGFTSPSAALTMILPGFLFLLSAGRRLDVLMTGEDTATSMGVSVGVLRVQTVIDAALVTGAAVSLADIIGFLGMMVPSVLSQAVGDSRRKLAALSAWLDAVFLMMMDGVTRWFTYPVGLPVGIAITLISGPFFMCLLTKPLKGS